MSWCIALAREFAHTASSLGKALYDWVLLRFCIAPPPKEKTFAFFVHPRSDTFIGEDVYGKNDIYRPFPLLGRMVELLPGGIGRKCVQWFARVVVPITLSKIIVRSPSGTYCGYLLSTVRTPELLFRSNPKETRGHLVDLFQLARKRGVSRVGLGALLPSLTKYGQLFTGSALAERPAVSTGHAYTGYVIVEYLRMLVQHRHADASRVRVAVVGAAGSTGKATLRTLKKVWGESVILDVLLVDVPSKQRALENLADEVATAAGVGTVSVHVDLTALQEAQYVVVVTNAAGAIIKPEHVRAGAVIIDDSQPRNTAPELSDVCVVLDVLARVPGLDCGFNFGFQTTDTSVTFSCLAETVLAAATGMQHDLAVGEVTDEVVARTLEIVEAGTRLGLVAPPPLFSFGRELSDEERRRVLSAQ